MFPFFSSTRSLKNLRQMWEYSPPTINWFNTRFPPRVFVLAQYINAEEYISQKAETDCASGMQSMLVEK